MCVSSSLATLGIIARILYLVKIQGSLVHIDNWIIDYLNLIYLLLWATTCTSSWSNSPFNIFNNFTCSRINFGKRIMISFCRSWCWWLLRRILLLNFKLKFVLKSNIFLSICCCQTFFKSLINSWIHILLLYFLCCIANSNWRSYSWTWFFRCMHRPSRLSRLLFINYLFYISLTISIFTLINSRWNIIDSLNCSRSKHFNGYCLHLFLNNLVVYVLNLYCLLVWSCFMMRNWGRCCWTYWNCVSFLFLLFTSNRLITFSLFTQ